MERCGKVFELTVYNRHTNTTTIDTVANRREASRVATLLLAKTKTKEN